MAMVATQTTQAINASTGADVTYAFPDHSRVSSFIIQSRNARAFRIAFASGGITAGNYLTIPGSSSYMQSADLTGKTIYLRSDAGQTDTLEVLVWTVN